MLGAIIGDTIGSVYERTSIKEIDFPLFSKETSFTDDTVLIIATANCILNGQENYAKSYKTYALKYPDRGYGGNFKKWVESSSMKTYDSFGNGSAMRVVPIGFAFDTKEKVLEHAILSAKCTHSHAEGIKGAGAVALAIYFARKGKSKKDIKNYIQDIFHYDLERTVEDIRPTYVFDVTCQETVPQAIISFLDSNNFEEAIRFAISLGGDSDTLACIAGGIAEAYYKEIPDSIKIKVWEKLPNEFQTIIDNFYAKIK